MGLISRDVFLQKRRDRQRIIFSSNMKTLALCNRNLKSIHITEHFWANLVWVRYYVTLFDLTLRNCYVFTVCWADFKQNCKNFWRDLRRVKEHASEIQNIFFSKSCIERRGIHQLGSTADSAWQPCCLSGGFHAL